MTAAEHSARLFMSGWYYWFVDDELAASICWATALDVINTVSFVGEA